MAVITITTSFCTSGDLKPGDTFFIGWKRYTVCENVNDHELTACYVGWLGSACSLVYWGVVNSYCKLKWRIRSWMPW